MARMLSSGVVLIVLGCLAAVVGVWAAPLSFVLIGGGVLLTLMGTVFTAVGHSKRTTFQEHVLFVARGDAQA